MYVLNANHISKSYKTAGETMRILQNVNLQVMKGEMVAIMGPSGSGKTTLLHVLTGVDTPDDGEIVIGGETFSQLTEEELLDQGIKPNTIRLSIGTENIDDIIEDLDEAFKAVK